MPRYDRTGPSGAGAGTGWGMGPCGGGLRRGCRGFGRYWKFGSQVMPQDEKQILADEAKMLQEDLKAINERLSELSAQK